jgi:hypothetical protein
LARILALIFGACAGKRGSSNNKSYGSGNQKTRKRHRRTPE